MVNVLMISLDKRILEPNSAVGRRMIRYGKLCDNLTIIVFTGRGYQTEQLTENIWAHPTNSLNRFFYVWDAYKLAKKILVVNGQWLVTTQDPFETAFVGFLIKKKFKIPLQVQIHTDFLSPYFARESFWNWKRVRFAKWVIPKADCLRVVSERIRKSIEVQFKDLKTKISVVPIYVDVTRYVVNTDIKSILRPKYHNFDFLILSLGRLTKEKNLYLLLDSFKEVVDNNSKTFLLIVGRGPEKKRLEFYIKKLKLEKNVEFNDWTPRPFDYFQIADLFVLSSNYEGYGMAAVEAMVAGCPVVMTDVGCAGEIIKNNENGLVVPVNNKKALTEAIIKMIENPKMRQRFTANGLTVVKTLLSEEETLSKLFQCP